MHCTRLAPELSATSRTVRIWIMAASFLHELLDEARDGEALVLADRTVLLDLDLIAGLELALLVVRLVAAARADVLAVEGIPAVVDHLDHDGLGHLGADDLAQQLASAAVRDFRGLRAVGRVLGHDDLASLFFVLFFLAGAAADLASPDAAFASVFLAVAALAFLSGAGLASAGAAGFAFDAAAGAVTTPGCCARRSVSTRARSRRVLRIALVSSRRLVKFFRRFWKTSRASDARSSFKSAALFSRRSAAFIGSLRGRGTCSRSAACGRPAGTPRAPSSRRRRRARTSRGPAARRRPTLRRRPCRHPYELRAASW